MHFLSKISHDANGKLDNSWFMARITTNPKNAVAGDFLRATFSPEMSVLYHTTGSNVHFKNLLGATHLKDQYGPTDKV